MARHDAAMAIPPRSTRHGSLDNKNRQEEGPQAVRGAISSLTRPERSNSRQKTANPIVSSRVLVCSVAAVRRPIPSKVSSGVIPKGSCSGTRFVPLFLGSEPCRLLRFQHIFGEELSLYLLTPFAAVD